MIIIKSVKNKYNVTSIFPEGMDEETYRIKAKEMWTIRINEKANEDFKTKDVIYFYMNKNNDIDIHPTLEWDYVKLKWYNKKKTTNKNYKL